jgi:hypothetical protein
MKLITELFEAHVITEAGENGQKKLYVEGIYLQQAVKNGNGRIYPPHVLEREVSRYKNEKIVTNRAMGELGHPSGPAINLERVSHRVVECRQDGNNYLGKALIIDTPYGKIAESLIQCGTQLGVSSRGMGSLREDKSTGAKIINDDYRLHVMIDLVAEPSAPEAFVNGVMENVNWRVNEIGEWVAETFDGIRADIHAAAAADLSEAKARAWEKFLTDLRETQEVEQMARSLKVDPSEVKIAMRRARAKLKVKKEAGSTVGNDAQRDRAVYAMVRQMLGKTQ